MNSKLKPDLKLCNVDMLDLGSEVLGNIYFKANKNAPALLMLKIGHVLEEKLFKQIKASPQQFFQDNLLRSKNQIEIKNILELFFAAISIEQKRKLRNEFFSKLNKGEFRFIELSFVFKQMFSQLPKDFYHQFYDRNEILYNHASRAAVTASLLALTQDFYDKKFVADIYMLNWFLDYGLVSKDLNYHVMRACEEERLNPGQGLSYLEKMEASKQDKDLFLNHPVLSYQKALDYAQFFTHSHLLEIITFHHENEKGSGFPFKKNFKHLSKVEQLIIITNRAVSFEKINYADNAFVFKDFFRKLEEDNRDFNKIVFMAEKVFRESA